MQKKINKFQLFMRFLYNLAHPNLHFQGCSCCWITNGQKKLFRFRKRAAFWKFLKNKKIPLVILGDRGFQSGWPCWSRILGLVKVTEIDWGLTSQHVSIYDDLTTMIVCVVNRKKYYPSLIFTDSAKAASTRISRNFKQLAS